MLQRPIRASQAAQMPGSGAIWSGRVPQQPPISCTPASSQRVALLL